MLEIFENENFYGHQKRLYWINERIEKSDEVLEVGCGTGSMLTIPLYILGKNIIGMDIAEVSINEAKKLAKNEGINKNIFYCRDIKEVDKAFDVVILAEVLEHINDNDINNFVETICRLVKAGGKLFITVPNGKGSYEIGQKYWKKPVEKYQKLFNKFINTNRIVLFIRKMRHHKLPVTIEKDNNQMTLSDSPHVQFFNYRDIIKIFSAKNFELKDFTGSALFSGVLINTFIPPISIICRINCAWGGVFPKISSGYYFEFIKRE